MKDWMDYTYRHRIGLEKIVKNKWNKNVYTALREAQNY